MTPFLVAFVAVCIVGSSYIIGGQCVGLFDTLRLGGEVSLYSFAIPAMFMPVIAFAAMQIIPKLGPTLGPILKLAAKGVCIGFGWPVPSWVDNAVDATVSTATVVAGKIASGANPVDVATKLAKELTEEAVDQAAEFAEESGVPNSLVTAALAAIQAQLGDAVHLEIKATYKDGTPRTIQVGEVISKALTPDMPSGAGVLMADTVPPKAPASIPAAKVAPTPPAPATVAGVAR